MYTVYCRAKKYARWNKYSNDFKSMQEAKDCKKYAEDIKAYDVNGNLLVYKIVIS